MQIVSIQWLRGIAALLVVFHHLSGIGREHGYAWPDFLIGGFGVDLFFVISGFLMVCVTQNQAQSWRASANFLARRGLRVVPVYWTVTLICVLNASLLISVPVNTWQIICSFLFLPTPIKDDLLFPVVLQGWTLLYEMYFYLLFGLALRWLRPACAVAWLAGFFAISVAFGLLKTSTLPAVVFYSDPLILEFIAGGTIGVIYCQRERGCRTTALTLLGLGLTLLWPLTEFGFKAHPHHLMRLAAWGIPAALIVGGCVFYEKYLQNQNRRLPHVGWLMTLAAWSYPLYLSHIMAFVLVKTGILSLKPPGPLYAAALLGGALLIAWLLHVVIERPTQQWGRQALARWFQLPGETAEEIKKLNPR